MVLVIWLEEVLATSLSSSQFPLVISFPLHLRDLHGNCLRELQEYIYKRENISDQRERKNENDYAVRYGRYR